MSSSCFGAEVGPSAKRGDYAELRIYGAIQTDEEQGNTSDVTPSRFNSEFEQIKTAGRLNVRINSEGGDLSVARMIYTKLKELKAVKNVFVDGTAASAASLIAMAGDRIIMADGARMMIHEARGELQGYRTQREFQKRSAQLNSLNTTMASIYSKRTGLPIADIRAMMAKETWMTAEEAVHIGFADQVISQPGKVAASASLTFSKPRQHSVGVITAAERRAADMIARGASGSSVIYAPQTPEEFAAVMAIAKGMRKAGLAG